jgi:CDP-glycerol glycerophosphotransferase
MNDRKRRLNALARGLADRLPAPVKSALRQLRQPATKPAAADQSALAPVLSVVVVASNAESYLRECLDSLQSQSLKRLEVLVVDDGSTDGTARVAHEVAAEDPRFRILVQPRLGLGASRNAGAQLARGRFLAFLNATDAVPRHAYANLVGSLRRTGSDFAAGSVRTVIRGRVRRPAWATVTHDLDRPAQTLAELSLALQDTCATNRVFRRSFWNTDVGGFPLSADGEAFAIVTATLQASRFDFLQIVSCIQHTRLVPGTLVPAPMSASELHSRLNWHRTTWRLVRGVVDPRISGHLLGRLIDGDLGDFAADAHRADASYRGRLQEAAQECLALADDSVWPHVRVERKLVVWLVANGRWADLEHLIHHFAIYGSMPRTEVRDGRVYAAAEQLPGVAGVPLEHLELGESQTAFSGCIERVAWDGDNLEVHGWAFIRGVDLATHPPQLTAWLTEPVTGFSHPCEITQLNRGSANQWSMFRYQDVAPGGFFVSIDTGRIDRTSGRWQLRLTIRAGGLERAAPIHAVAPGGLRRLMSARHMKQAHDLNRVVPKLDPELGFGIHVRPERIQARWLTTDGAGKAAGALRLVDSRLGGLVSVTAVSPLDCVAADLSDADADGLQHFELKLPVRARAAVDWEFRAVDVHHHEHRVCWPVEAACGRQVGGGFGDACWRRSTTGYCDLTTDWAVAEAQSVTVCDEELSIDLRLTGLGVSDCAGAHLSGSLVDVPVRDVEPVGDRVRLVFPLRAARWGAPELPLPSGNYRILLTSGDQVLCSEELITLLPKEGLATSHSYRVGRDGPAELVISLAAPLSEEERSRVAQGRLGTWYQESTFTPTESVLFQSYRGEFATDSQLALHSQLRTQRPDLELVWGVKDLSVPVPEGGRPLLIESRAWYAALGSSRYLCRNIEFERYFRKRPYQRYLQTFHGYPFKSMGASLWRAQGRPESVITSECARRSDAWDAVVVPESFCVDLYQQEYRFSGETLVTGYPRNDVLLGADVAATRSRVLEQLGIAAEQIVVLYAPTWRDTVATSPWTAKLFDGLDLEALVEQLGDGYAVLLRGHNYNLREGLAPIARHVWDVSAYPEINDLMLAADVAVLDYSSIRFDWLVTGKPVLFFVPDLVDYLSSRGILFDYKSTAPGPLLGSTAEVTATLRDLGGVAAEYAAARELFNKQFNRLHDGHATERVINAFF